MNWYKAQVNIFFPACPFHIRMSPLAAMSILVESPIKWIRHSAGSLWTRGSRSKGATVTLKTNEWMPKLMSTWFRIGSQRRRRNRTKTLFDIYTIMMYIWNCIQIVMFQLKSKYQNSRTTCISHSTWWQFSKLHPIKSPSNCQGLVCNPYGKAVSQGVWNRQIPHDTDLMFLASVDGKIWI